MEYSFNIILFFYYINNFKYNEYNISNYTSNCNIVMYVFNSR